MALDETLDLKKAFRRVMTDKRDDTWPDIVGYRDFRRTLDENLTCLKSRVALPGSYSAGLPLGIDLPKKGFTLRPGVVPLIEDRLIYQAVADFLLPYFEAESCVYSNRPLGTPNSSRMFMRGVDLWLEFQSDVEKYCNIYPYVVETDITAYFEHISHDFLLHRLDDLFSSCIDKQTLREIKQLLARLWRRWTKGTSRHGIPQVNDASSFFGNVYLDELDKWMLRHDYVFLRYVDDMRIFALDEPGARIALAELVTQLREMGLYVASAKTSIKESPLVLSELIEGRQRMDAIETEIKSRIPERLEKASTMLESFANELIDTPEHFNDRHFRYCVNRFKKLRVNDLGEDSHNRMVAEVLQRLKCMPYCTDIFVDYLSLFSDEDSVQHEVLEFLEGPYNIYPWQEMLLLELLIRSEILPEFADRTARITRSVALNTLKHPACRAKALILLGKNGDYADRREIRACYYDESREDVRRAVVFAIQEMQKGERDNFYNSIHNDANSVRLITQYVQSLSSLQYHFYNPPAGFDVIESYEDSDDIDELGSEDFLY